DLGAPALIAALAGWLCVGRGARGVQWLAAASALAAAGFATISLAAGENIRYGLLLAPLVAVGAGWFLSRLAGRGRFGLGWAGLFIAALGWMLLGAWLPLIFTRYH
ncbi:MAG TPA: hypothetical protein VM536_18505, partial [Chloroflexia bacterium]|nr:hypothetical protein [Chloroflexia bacterium]